ncbi:serine/threonine protein kinase [Nocardioides caeni]|uniref:non-specific serine/threonine protein kinase n=1 Tax=Nocardioides caeni TaxID=574700 RepID=A0A4V4HJB7_9ACTN|nr:serine/threonine-protein kinase [Nocardioides caeni]THV09926.1 serine/threonine protein kinase [Nocardioides caeni]
MAMPRPGEIVGRYRIDREIGRGAMGVVLAATDVRIGRTVAIKMITAVHDAAPAFLSRFHAEATVLAGLDSSHIIAIFDHDDTDDGTPFIVTQYVDGPDLAQLLADHGPLSPQEALTLCAQVARALGDAHRAGVVHRDVKPANVLVRGAGTPDVHAYLCDFGIARGDSAGLTATGAVAGTWAYLAPERTQGAQADASTDLYSLGCLLWTCLTGAPPYAGSDVQMAIAHAQSPVRQLVGDDPFITQLNACLARLMAKQRGDRPADATAARTELEALAAAAPRHRLSGAPNGPAAPYGPGGPAGAAAPTAPPPVAPPTLPRSGRRRSRKARTALIATALAVVLTISGAAVWAGSRLLADDEGDPNPSDSSSPGAQPDRIEGDIDGDGFGDVTVIERESDGGDALIALARSTGRRLEVSTPAVAEIGVPALADVDGNGITETAWQVPPTSAGGIVLRIVALDGSLTQVTVAETEDETSWAGVPVFADVDGDGLDDLVMDGTRPGASNIQVALSDGEAFSELTSWWDGPDVDADVVTAGDFDCDGDEDLAAIFHIGSATTRELHLLRSDDGRFTDTGAVPVLSHTWGESSWLAADVDGDDVDELVAVAGRAGQIGVADLADDRFGELVIARDAAGTSAEWDAYVEEFGGSLPPHRYGASDVDGDGDADLVRLNDETSAALGVLIADEGRFAEPVTWAVLGCALCEELPQIVP